MNRISTAASFQSALLNIMSASNRQAEAQRQVSTGMKANDLKGYGYQAVSLTAANSVKSRLDTHLDNAKQLASTLEVQDQAMGEVAEATQDARGAIADALASGSAVGLKETLEGVLDRINVSLNTRSEGRYLFGGGQSQGAPLNAYSLADLVAAPTVASLFGNDRMVTNSRIDDNLTIQTGFLADDLGTQTIAALQTVAQLDAGPTGPLNGPLTPAQTTQLQGLLTTFDTAYKNLNDQVAKNGAAQNRVDNAISSLTDRQTAMEGMISNIAEVDGAEAASRLKLAQVALEASAQVFASLNTSSLLNDLSR